MTADVHPLPQRVKKEFEPHEPLVKMLEQLLEYAKDGRMQAAAVAVVYHDHLVPGGEANDGWHCASGTRFALSHAINRLHHKWMADCLKDAP